MNVTLRQLQALLAVAEQGSFSRAAERLHVTQSAVSVLVRELERELRLRLFDRTTRRVEPTPAGAAFAAQAAKLVADLDLAVRHAHDLAELRRGRLTVAAPPLLAATLLPGAIAAFRSSHPGVRVELVDTRTDLIVAQVRAGEADLGVGTFQAGEDGIERVHLAADRLVAVCPGGHALAGAAPLPWPALAGWPLITLTRDSGIRSLVEYGFEAAGAALDIAFEVNQITTALALAAAGLGVAVLPAYAMASPQSAGLMARPLEAPAVVRDVVAIHRSGRALAPAAAAFVTALGGWVAGIGDRPPAISSAPPAKRRRRAPAARPS